MTRFGSYGRTGNQLFQWAFLSSLARKKQTTLVLPESELSRYFENFPSGVLPENAIKVTEPEYGYHPDFYDSLDYANNNYDFTGYWQNEKYFDSEIKNQIVFKKEFITHVKEKYSGIDYSNSIAIGIRRSDYLSGGNYHILDEKYYYHAIAEIAGDEKMQKIFISDDPQYCERHYGCLENTQVITGPPMEQLCLMSLCRRAIIANSTFHWWGAWLGEGEKSFIAQPYRLFSGQLLKKHGDKNFYCEKWTTVAEKKIDLRDVTFTIPVMIDSKERKENLELVVCLLQRYFDTNIIVGEIGKAAGKIADYCSYYRFDIPCFHRTKMLNMMASAAKTKYIANWDADVFCPPMQIIKSVEKLMAGAGMVYPYEYKFMRIPRQYIGEIYKNYDLGVFSKYDFPSSETKQKPSFGGAVLWEKEAFFSVGGENENMISYGPEDVERYVRAKKLGIAIERVKGYLYHFDHPRGPNSSKRNPYFQSNKREFDRICQMGKNELSNYINSKKWTLSFLTETITMEGKS